MNIYGTISIKNWLYKLAVKFKDFSTTKSITEMTFQLTSITKMSKTETNLGLI